MFVLVSKSDSSKLFYEYINILYICIKLFFILLLDFHVIKGI